MTLGSGNMSLAVELPNGEELNEWLAVNTIEFYNEISILYGTLMEVCRAPGHRIPFSDLGHSAAKFKKYISICFFFE